MVKNRLVQIRLEMGFRFQNEFAKHLGITSWLYNRYEKNAIQPSSENLLRICQITNRKIEEVIYKAPIL